MFKWFKKKVEEVKELDDKLKQIETEEVIQKEIWLLRIRYKNVNSPDRMFTNKGEKYPYDYRKFLNWYLTRESEIYNFVCSKGNITFNREDILDIEVKKELV